MSGRSLGPGLALLLLLGCDGADISPRGMKAYEISLATSTHELAIAWHGGRIGHDAIYLRFADSKGDPQGSPLRLTDGRKFAYEPDLQLIGDEPLLAWYEKDPQDESLTAVLARYDRKGSLLWRRELGEPGHGRNPVVRIEGETLFVAWLGRIETGRDAVWTATFNAQGQPMSPPRYAGPASLNTWNLNAAVETGVFYVVYDAKVETRAKELQLLTVRPEGIQRMPLSIDDGFESVYPDIAFNEGQAALAWFDQRDGNNEIYLFAGKLSEPGGTLDDRALRVTSTPGNSIGAYLAWNGDRIGLVWCDSTPGPSQLHAQYFDREGAALGPVQRLTRNDLRSSIPAIRAWHDGFAIAWNEYVGRDSSSGHDGITSSTAKLKLLP